MPIALVREGKFDSLGTATAALTPVTITAGNTVVIVCHPRTGSTQDVSSVADSAGNTYTSAVTAFLTGSFTRCSIWYCLNALGMTAGTVTATMSASLSLTTNISEWSGVSTGGQPDVTLGRATPLLRLPQRPALPRSPPALW